MPDQDRAAAEAVGQRPHHELADSEADRKIASPVRTLGDGECGNAEAYVRQRRSIMSIATGSAP